ncbi:MAG: hypothetical protein H8M99_15630 [Gloeobacteraceae cyanobacterium ES-bin-144]|nr:hypothetical protein [Verrucomicrobiales bacterium]
MIAIGVLAVAIPLVFAALAQSANSAMTAEAETRCASIIPACLAEVRASREGHSGYFAATSAGQSFPTKDETWMLAFSKEGRHLGKLHKDDYDHGIRELDGEPIYYISAMSCTPDLASGSKITSMMRVDITLEFPASAPVKNRKIIFFHSCIP